MPVEVKPLEDVVSKWKGRAAVSGPEYSKGVGRAKDWQGKTLAAEEAYKTGVATASAEGRFGKGVGQVSTEEWRRKAQTVGPRRWSEGVGAAESDFRSGIGKVLSTIAATDVPERGPSGDPKNYERVRAVGEALHKMKTGA